MRDRPTINWPTARQLEFLYLLTEGKQHKHIARITGVSASSIKQTLYKLRLRFGFKNNEQAVAHAFRRGWIE